MMNKENMLKFMSELKEFCEKHKECEKCELDAYCRAFGNAALPFEWKIPNENKRWRAEDGEEYWFVQSFGELAYMYDYRRNMDNYMYYSHNYFKTKEEAEIYARVLETEMLLKKFADEHNYKAIDWKDTAELKCFLLFEYDTAELGMYSTFDNCEPRVIYFNSKDIVREAVNEIGKDRIIEYLTYEW